MGTLERLQSDLILSPFNPRNDYDKQKRTSEKEGFLSIDVNFWVPKGWRLEVGKPFQLRDLHAPSISLEPRSRKSQTPTCRNQARMSPQSQARPDRRCGWMCLAWGSSVALFLI